MSDFNFSVFTPAVQTGLDGSGLATVAGEALRAAGATDRWQLTTSGVWCSLTPHNRPRRAQGWKLHVSATVASAETVLARTLPVLLTADSAFKFASTLEHVAQLNARHTPRGHSGKFITVYPESDEEAVRLAAQLHQATAGLAGPRILSDRPYATDSLVHYRYGAFVEQRRLSNDGLYSWVIMDPDGNPVEDRRVGQYLPPPWAQCPFPQAATNGASLARGEGGGVLIGDRFLAREAIRHTNKGSVYRVVDTHTGAQAIVKEARPHVAADDTGRDVRDLLRAEARALEKVGPLGVAPRLLALFEQSQHLFLAEELVPGVTLYQWTLEGMRTAGWRRHVPAALEMAVRLVELMDTAHRAGLVLRDFTPNNVMVPPDGEPQLIDLELTVVAAEQDEEPIRAGTPAYAAPEQLAGAHPAVEADYYSLGATICFVVLGAVPYFLEDVPKARSTRERLTEWLAVRGKALDIPTNLQTLILGLMDDEPEQRWTISTARRALAAARKPAERASRAHPSPGHAPEGGVDPLGDGRLGDDQLQQAVDGLVGYLLDSMDPTDGERLWPLSCGNGAPDPCTVQLGAAGILGVLTSCFELTGDQRLPEAIATAGRWITGRVAADAKRPPALYFGEAGIAWSLYEAGRVLGDDALAERGLALARTLPVSAEHRDVTHGTAGIGLAFLHLWLRTGDRQFLDRASGSADTLVTSAEELPSGINWGTPAAYESRLAGGRYHGFAHGTAGVGYFLLAAGSATGRSDCLELAARAGETLLANAIVADGMAVWGVGPGDGPTAPYWCHGSAGIGSFLTRLHRVTGDDRFATMADMSARAVAENSWRGVLGQCHGFAGNGDFLLDMAEGPDGERYQAMAGQLARVIFASRAHRDGRVVFPDELGVLSPSWGDGVSGVLAFLLRLRHRCARLWMVDPLLERSRPSALLKRSRP